MYEMLSDSVSSLSEACLWTTVAWRRNVDTLSNFFVGLCEDTAIHPKL